MSVFTSTLPEDLILKLRAQADSFSIPMNKLIEKH